MVDHVRKLLPGQSEPVDAFTKTVFISGAALSDEQRDRLMDIAARCPIQRVLEGAPVIITKPGKLIDAAFDN